MPFTTGHTSHNATYKISIYTSNKAIITSEQRIIDIYILHLSNSIDKINKQN